MNFKPDLIEALQDTVTNQSKSINALLVNRDLMRQLIDSQAKIIESLTKLKEKAENEVERLKRLSDEQSKVINEFRNGF